MTARTRLIAGNWKMNRGPSETSTFCEKFRRWWDSADEARASVGEGKLEIAIFPPFISIGTAKEGLHGISILLGAQNCHQEASGAFTGEIAPAMLKDAGCRFVLVGHSERRQLFGEQDETIALKVRAVLAEGMDPVLCVGETLKERESGETFAVVERQFLKALAGLDPDRVAERTVVAYEPVWAIGTGRTARDEDAQEVCQCIRRLAAERFGDETAQKLRILYGGSVKASNATGLLNMPDIDGALVGGASLEVASFGGIIQGCIAR